MSAHVIAVVTGVPGVCSQKQGYGRDERGEAPTGGN